MARPHKDEFLAMLAHELRNPLAAITTAMQLSTMSGVQDQINWSMEVINRQVKHLTRLIDDLLDVSRITRGKVQLRKETIDAYPVINGALHAIRPARETTQDVRTLRPGRPVACPLRRRSRDWTDARRLARGDARRERHRDQRRPRQGERIHRAFARRRSAGRGDAEATGEDSPDNCAPSPGSRRR